MGRAALLAVTVMLAGCAGAGVPRAAMPGPITATTNEPFYAAIIEGDTITLRGVDQPERRLPIVKRETLADGWRWWGQGGGTTLAVTVLRAPCEDDMSGAARPYRATLVLDGRSANGCAFDGRGTPR